LSVCRQQLHALYKQVSLSLSRKAKRKDPCCCDEKSFPSVAASEDKEELEWISSIDSLPTEVHRVILSHLDPIDLIAIACTSSIWRNLALANHVWEPWLVYASGMDCSPSHDGHGSQCRAFAEEALGVRLCVLGSLCVTST